MARGIKGKQKSKKDASSSSAAKSPDASGVGVLDGSTKHSSLKSSAAKTPDASGAGVRILDGDTKHSSVKSSAAKTPGASGAGVRVLDGDTKHSYVKSSAAKTHDPSGAGVRVPDGDTKHSSVKSSTAKTPDPSGAGVRVPDGDTKHSSVKSSTAKTPDASGAGVRIPDGDTKHSSVISLTNSNRTVNNEIAITKVCTFETENIADSDTDDVKDKRARESEDPLQYQQPLKRSKTESKNIETQFKTRFVGVNGLLGWNTIRGKNREFLKKMFELKMGTPIALNTFNKSCFSSRKFPEHFVNAAAHLLDLEDVDLKINLSNKEKKGEEEEPGTSQEKSGSLTEYYQKATLHEFAIAVLYEIGPCNDFLDVDTMSEGDRTRIVIKVQKLTERYIDFSREQAVNNMDNIFTEVIKILDAKASYDIN